MFSQKTFFILMASSKGDHRGKPSCEQPVEGFTPVAVADINDCRRDVQHNQNAGKSAFIMIESPWFRPVARPEGGCICQSFLISAPKSPQTAFLPFCFTNPFGGLSGRAITPIHPS